MKPIGSRIKLERMTLGFPNFNGIFPGLRVIHLSDLHISSYGSQEKKLVRLVNREDPDIVCITGDLLVNYRNEFSSCIQVLRELKARRGIFVVLGNAEHTLRPMEVMVEFEEAIRAVPVTLLTNESAELRINGQSLHIMGVDDPFFQFDDFEQAVRGIPPDAPILLLVHSPDIFFPRSDALVLSLLDSPLKKDHFRDWGWVDRTYYAPEAGDVYFSRDGVQTLRVQSRQDGVAIDAILLNPYPELDEILTSGDRPTLDRLAGSDTAHPSYPDLITITAADIDTGRIQGKWKKTKDSTALSGYRLDDYPLGRRWFFQPSVEPRDFFETEFETKKGLRYHVWMRMKAHRGSPYHDSVYVQFSDSVDEQGRDRYRIGKPAYSKSRLEHVDLILTGHTHGGQVRIPLFGPVTTMTSVGKRFVSGMYAEGRSQVYVSRGFGTSALPIRLFCPPEITLFNFQ
ncbi:metallophosphoesterase [Acidobacteriota bacterium]